MTKCHLVLASNNDKSPGLVALSVQGEVDHLLRHLQSKRSHLWKKEVFAFCNSLSLNTALLSLVSTRDARPAPAPGKMAATAPEIVMSALPHPENAPSLTVTLPHLEDFTGCPAPPHPENNFFLPAPKQKSCPVHP